MQLKVTLEHNIELMSPLNAVEIKNALFEMNSDKSLRLDGMNAAFYKKFWNIVGEDVIVACKNFFINGHF